MSAPQSTLPSPLPSNPALSPNTFALDFLSLAGIDDRVDIPSKAEGGEEGAVIGEAQAPASTSKRASSSSSRGRRRLHGSGSGSTSTVRGSSSSTTRDQQQMPYSPNQQAEARGMDLDLPSAPQWQGANPGLDVDAYQHFLASMSGVTEGHQALDAAGIPLTNNLEGLEGFLNGEGYDTNQAAILQHQLEQIHMQSPNLFHENQAFSPLAQMFLNQSPLSNPPQSKTQDKSRMKPSDFVNGGDGSQRWTHGPGGLVTPAPSGDMLPQLRPDMMTPMQLESLARASTEGMQGNFENFAPLLSPALTMPHGSTYLSAVNPTPGPSDSPGHYQNQFQAAHNGNGNGNGFVPQPQSPLEALEAQHRQFQQQLALLQQQQRQLEATAAAVAASTATSPYVQASISSDFSSGYGGRSATTPGVHTQNGPHSAGSISTPSPGYFSPLTSPALEAANRIYHRPHHHASPGFLPNQKRPPHPLSTLSSPALNPVGSSGGAHQTLSPALEPQNNADMSDPDYLRALVGLLDNHDPRAGQTQNHAQAQTNGGSGASSTYISPAGSSSSYMPGAMSSLGQSPLISSTGSTLSGPHRSSLPAKTRPSPMMKPANHRLPGAQTHARHGSGSAISSPIAATPARYHVPVPGMGYLPPSAIDQRGVQAHHQALAMHVHGEMSSTPSPVDLNTLMPPPPVPNGPSRGMAPLTPASLMNLGQGQMSRESAVGQYTSPMIPQGFVQFQGQYPNVPSTQVIHHEQQNGSASAQVATAVLPKRQAATKIAQATAPGRKKAAINNGSTSITPVMTPSNGTVSGPGKKVKIAPAGKRALAMRPPGVGVRAAIKGAAAAAALVPPEGEVRRTSHKAAEQKRRDSLKAGFDELRLLLPPINTEALDPESGEPIPGSSAPRLLPKSSLVPDDNPNRGVSKVALLKFSNDYIVKMRERLDKRDDYIERLKEEISRLRLNAPDGDEENRVRGEDGRDLLEIDMAEGEEDDEDLESPSPDQGAEEEDDDEEEEGYEDVEDDMEVDGDGDVEVPVTIPDYTISDIKGRPRRARSIGGVMSTGLQKTTAVKRPALSRGLTGGSVGGRN